MDEADAIASTVLSAFEKIEANKKPELRSNGVGEWVPLSGIVAKFGTGKLKCLALATGMKCLPASKIPLANGCVIHDWHAEILTLRAFNHFVLRECHEILGGNSSEFLKIYRQDTIEDDPNMGTQPFSWRDGISLHMYCSEAPCGDASMELTMDCQDDPAPWTVPTIPIGKSTENMPPPKFVLAGRGYFSRLGSVRRKPGRGDSPPTLSKSCSDKLALRQCTSLLCGLSSLVVAYSSGVHLKTIVVPSAQYSDTGFLRCFSDKAGRMAPIANQKWPGGYYFVPVTVKTTSLEFSFSKRALLKSSVTSPRPITSCNKSIVWTCNGVNECLIGGVLRGHKADNTQSASSISRRRLLQLVCEIITVIMEETENITVQAPNFRDILHAETYHDIKASHMLASRRHVKKIVTDLALRGWIQNDGDDQWKPGALDVRKI